MSSLTCSSCACRVENLGDCNLIEMINTLWQSAWFSASYVIVHWRKCMTSVIVNILAKVYPICSFAILEGPTMPIIGEGEEEPNERYELFIW